MTAALILTIAMTAMALMPGSISTSAAQGTAGQSASNLQERNTGKSSSSPSGTKERQVKKKRRSSGKQIIEETTTEERVPADRARSQSNKGKSSGTTADIGSGGGGVTGATGK